MKVKFEFCVMACVVLLYIYDKSTPPFFFLLLLLFWVYFRKLGCDSME